MLLQRGREVIASMSELDKEAHFAEFESVGEDAVRLAISTNQYKIFALKVPHAQEWLRLKEESRASQESSGRKDREEEALSIAKEANRIALSAARWAMWAAIIAIIAIVIATKDQILALIFTRT